MSSRRRIGVGCALLALLAPVGPGALGDGSAAPARSRVERVLVYSNEARVFHRARVELGPGQNRVALVDLPPAARRDSVRVRSKTARIVRVEVTRARGELPLQVKSRALVARIEAVLDQRRDLRAERDVLRAEQQLVRSLTLRREPERRDGRAAREGLFAGAWQQILAWTAARGGQIASRLAALRASERALADKLHALRVEARELDPARAQRALPRVEAVLAGAGRHAVEVSYRVTGVRWVPSYDLRYDPARRVVEATYYAVVQQRTGEPWKQAALRFSTGLPRRLLEVPELATLTLGRRRDFTPRPRERVEPPPRPWRPTPAPVSPDPELLALRRLIAVDSAAGQADASGETTVDGRDKDRAEPADKKRSTGAPDDGLVRKKETLKQLERYAQRTRTRSLGRTRSVRVLTEQTAEEAEAPPPPSPAAARPRFSLSSVSRSAPSTPRQVLPWTDEGYRGPSLHRDLPAAAARGYRFVLYAPGRHSVPASDKRQRVPLFSRTLAVTPVHHIRPGLSRRVYLMATLKNTTGRPILRGHANLFAGSMFAGRTWLNTALPGRTLKLPLGVDDAVKVERHVAQRTVEEGVLFKDDVSAYTVRIEIQNNRQRPISVELLDQLPVAKGRKIEVKAFASPSGMKLFDRDRGKVRWRGRVAPGKVRKLSFSFQIVRPKDWKVRQHDG